MTKRSWEGGWGVKVEHDDANLHDILALDTERRDLGILLFHSYSCPTIENSSHRGHAKMLGGLEYYYFIPPSRIPSREVSFDRIRYCITASSMNLGIIVEVRDNAVLIQYQCPLDSTTYKDLFHFVLPSNEDITAHLSKRCGAKQRQETMRSKSQKRNDRMWTSFAPIVSSHLEFLPVHG